MPLSRFLTLRRITRENFNLVTSFILPAFQRVIIPYGYDSKSLKVF